MAMAFYIDNGIFFGLQASGIGVASVGNFLSVACAGSFLKWLKDLMLETGTGCCRHRDGVHSFLVGFNFTAETVDLV